MCIIIDLKIELFPQGDKKLGKRYTIPQMVNALGGKVKILCSEWSNFA